MLSNLKPIELPPAREQVSSYLRKAIFRRELKEGEEITLESIGNILSVSVTPVREAFQMLQREGLIELKKGKSAVVLGVTKQYIEDHFELRMLLESRAAELVVNKKADLSNIKSIHKKAKNEIEKGFYDNYSDYNYMFHNELWKAAGNEKMRSLLKELWNGLSVSMYMTVEDYAENSLKEHEEILKALEEKDAQKAYEITKEHLIRSKEDVLTYYE